MSLVKKKYLQNLFVFLGGCFIAILILEIFLRFYPPFSFTIKHDDVILPRNAKYFFSTNRKGLEKTGVHSKNELGFRGESKPKNLENYISIITVGGSTTECYYQKDGKDWPTLLNKNLNKYFNNIWLNNAGFGGHSTYGHQKILDSHIKQIKPNYIIYLIGANDTRLDTMSKEDWFFKKTSSNWKKVLKKSEIINFTINLIRAYQAIPFSKEYPEFSEWEQIKILTHEEKLKEIQKYNTSLAFFEKKLSKLISSTKNYNIEPILVTQPLLTGSGICIDPETKIDLSKLKFKELDGQTTWELLELFNNITRKVAKQHNILLIDLAKKMPKNTLYYFDFVHFSDKGSEKVSEIISTEMIPFLQSNKVK